MLVKVNSRSAVNRRKRTIKKQPVSMGPGALRFITIFILAILTIIYLVQSTKGSTKQIEISDIQDKTETLKSQRQDIGLEAVRLKSLQNLNQNPEASGYEQVTQTEDLSR